MNNLKKLRLSKNLKQAEIAELLNVTQGTYSNWETNKSEIDFCNLKKLAEFFNVTTDYILDRELDEKQSLIFQDTMAIIEKLGITPEKFKNISQEDYQYLKKTIDIIAEKHNK